jgi:hypothetical protein
MIDRLKFELVTVYIFDILVAVAVAVVVVGHSSCY